MEIQQKIDHYFLLLFLVSQQIIAIVCAIYFFHSAQMLQVIFFIVLSSVILIALAFYCIFKHYSLAEWTLLLALALGCFFLIITSSDQISSMWCLIAVPIFGVLLGHNQGVIILKSIYIAAIVILLTKPSSYVNVKYDGVLILRFLFSYALLVIFSITMEKFRFTNLRQITASTMAIDMGLQDVLTKLPNRHFMEEQLKQKYQQFGTDIIEFSIILADLDNCKVFNDRYGREVGDMILIKLAQLLNNELRDEDIIGRWSGNQFILLLPNINQNTAVTIAERIRLKTSQQTLESHGDQLRITLSLGVCSTQNSIDLDDLLSVAENCVYQAKQMGRNLVISA